jgi:hypothetical protein
MRSCSNRVIELNLKMLILTRFVTKNGLITPLSTADSEAPASTRTVVTSLFPLRADRCRGVHP